MRSTNKGFRPRLEMLEDRWVPATVHDVAGDLLISGQTKSTLTVAATGVGQITVTDGTLSPVTYSNVGSLIEITGTNLSDTIIFSGVAADFAGNLLITSGNGNDIVDLSGTVPGSVTVITGLGNDSLNLGTTSAGTAAFNVGGSLIYDSTYGNDTVTTTAATTVSGNASLTGLQNLTLTSALTVKGALNLTDISAGFPLDVTGAGALTVGEPTGSGPLESLTVTGAAGADKFLPTGVVTVTGNATFNFGQSVGASAMTMPAGSSVGGNLTYNGGNGGDTVTFATGDSFAGNATLNLGNGGNSLVLNEAWSVAGNLTIAEGNGGNNPFAIGASTAAATVAGNLSITQGNGTNGKVTVWYPPAGLLIYHGGNGTDSLDLETTTTPAATGVYDVYITFGTGMDTLAFDVTPGGTGNGDTFVGTVIGNGGTNAFSQGTNANTQLIDISFINFP